MTRNLLQKVEESLRQMFAVREDDGQVILSVPVQYPSGSLCTVEISGGGESVWVSDRGLGFLEVEMMGADGGYSRIARREATLRGVSFDGRSIFGVNIPVSQLAAGIVAVANASVSAAAETIRVEQEKQIAESQTLIYERVQLAFPNAEIAHQLEISGSRSQWTVHNVVRESDQIGIFEPTTNHPNSISAKYLMFSDLASIGVLHLNAVVADPKKLDAKGQMLRDVANIIAVDDSIDRYQMGLAA